MDSLNEAPVEKVESSLKVHTFTTKIAEKVIKFEIIKFKDSVFLWIGDKIHRNFEDLSLALALRSSAQPVCTKIMGEQTNLTSNNLANKLSKKLRKPVYVSFNLVDDRLTVTVVNQRIAEEIQKNPQYF